MEGVGGAGGAASPAVGGIGAAGLADTVARSSPAPAAGPTPGEPSTSPLSPDRTAHGDLAVGTVDSAGDLGDVLTDPPALAGDLTDQPALAGDDGRAAPDPLASARRVARRRRHLLGLRPLAAAVAVGALIVTGVLAWLATAVNASTERHLLLLQTRQAAAAFGAGLGSRQPQLTDALQVQTDTGNPADFKRFAAPKTRRGAGFASISLWRLSAGGATLLAQDGTTPRLVADHRAAAFFAGMRPSTTLHVTSILPGQPPAIGYAEYPPGEPAGDAYVAYAESLLPSHRRLAVPKSSAFKDLNFALYLGRGQHQARLIEASLPTPVHEPHAAVSVPFGDTAITVVATPSVPLSGSLSSALAWVVVGVGVALAAASGATVEYVLRRRADAEELAAENRRLFVQQRDIAATLQQALLADLPSPEGLDIAARYVPGVRGIDVGGDWYDVVCPSDGRCLFVVGDVSGRGLQAATTMASLRFAARAYFTQGDGPRAVLAKLDHLLGIDTHQQFATVLVGELDVAHRRVTLASAGHYPPVLAAAGGAWLVDVPTGPPIGIDGPERPGEVVVDVPDGALLLGFTDGLIERRGEHLDAGLARLCDVAAHAAMTGGADDAVAGLATTLLADGGDDDVVILGIRMVH